MSIQNQRESTRMRQIAFSLPEDVVELVERQARFRYKDRAEHIRDLVIAALIGNGSLKPQVENSERV